MGFEFKCSNCNQALEAEEDWIGKRLDCPGCSAVIIVPDPHAQMSRRDRFLMETQDMMKLPEKAQNPKINPEQIEPTASDEFALPVAPEMTLEESMEDTIDETLPNLKSGDLKKEIDRSESKVLALTGMICGILSLIPYAGAVFCLLGFAFSSVAVNKINRGKAKGTAFAAVGLIASFVGLVLIPFYFKLI